MCSGPRPCGGARNPDLCGGARGSGPTSVPGESPRRGGYVASPPPRACLPRPVRSDRGGGGGVGRGAGNPGPGPAARARGGEVSVQHLAAGEEGGRGARVTRPGQGWGWGARRESLPFRAVLGDLCTGDPPPRSSQPREQRVWEARPGSGSGGGARREGGLWGQGGASPRFLPRPEDGKLQRGRLRIRAGSGSLPTGSARSLPPPASPPPPGPGPGAARRQRAAARAEPRGSSSPCRRPAPPRPSRRAGS